MGSPEALYPPKLVKSLSKKEYDEISKELRRLLRASPGIRKIIAAHRSANVKLRAKLAPTLRRFKKRAK
jgi:hypothetical protein